jgi:putative phosphoribosyl transferase
MTLRFRNRREAGRHLATLLTPYAHRSDVIVLALPRGGVPVAFEVARALDAPLDVFVVRKLGVPGHEEFAMGAIATGGVMVLDQGTLAYLNIPHSEVERVAAEEKAELERREREYRSGQLPLDVAGKTVILVDDGLATGASMRAAVRALRKRAPRRIIIAAPVASAEACEAMRQEADECVCTSVPEPLFGVGVWYRDFSQTEDYEVQALLASARRQHSVAATGGVEP